MHAAMTISLRSGKILSYHCAANKGSEINLRLLLQETWRDSYYILLAEVML